MNEEILLEIKRGESIAIILEFTDENGNAINLTSAGLDLSMPSIPGISISPIDLVNGKVLLYASKTAISNLQTLNNRGSITLDLLINTDPQLLYPGRRGDFRPTLTSPVRRAGESNYRPTLDFDLLPRETNDIDCYAVRKKWKENVCFLHLIFMHLGGYH